MNKKIKCILATVIMVSTICLPGCYMTGPQLMDWLGGENGLAGLTITAIWNTRVTPVVNPDNDPITQSFLNLGRRVTTQLVTNRINRNIPMDP